jgi:hypothetical protein
MHLASWKDPAEQIHQLLAPASSRKKRLFACACCRRLGALLREEASVRALDVAERFAEGLAHPHELQEAYRAAQEVAAPLSPEEGGNVLFLPGDGSSRGLLLGGQVLSSSRSAWEVLAGSGLEGGLGSLSLGVPQEAPPAYWAARAAAEAAHPDAAACALLSSLAVRRALDSPSSPFSGEARAQLALVEELVGTILCERTVEPAWLAWQQGTVGMLAREIGEARRFEDLPVLADALEDAGCTDGSLLAHLRGPGPHVPGCWGLDAVLAKS